VTGPAALGAAGADVVALVAVEVVLPQLGRGGRIVCVLHRDGAAAAAVDGAGYGYGASISSYVTPITNMVALPAVRGKDANRPRRAVESAVTGMGRRMSPYRYLTLTGH